MTFIEKSAALASNVEEARWLFEWRCRVRGSVVTSWRSKFRRTPEVSARAVLAALGLGVVLGIPDPPR